MKVLPLFAITCLLYGLLLRAQDWKDKAIWTEYILFSIGIIGLLFPLVINIYQIQKEKTEPVRDKDNHKL
ncbi:hypothetical protein [Bacillus suaedaesalsae]|uniref:Uncharacterized protein n=1 Tax=Bacillus suaedaesalsae TaxID=2810349 RepID=A0ABS2DDZ1_9BACI|nr:hypothetical protein [Bacillus suaedaesalsae]MBM6616667.1 hypothetical protein [Bacillus suaedaesalsae]